MYPNRNGEQVLSAAIHNAPLEGLCSTVQVLTATGVVFDMQPLQSLLARSAAVESSDTSREFPIIEQVQLALPQLALSDKWLMGR